MEPKPINLREMESNLQSLTRWYVFFIGFFAVIFIVGFNFLEHRIKALESQSTLHFEAVPQEQMLYFGEDDTQRL